MAAKAKQDNGFKPDQLKAFINRIETIKDEIASETGTFMATVRSMKDDIKDIYAEAKDAGIPLKALKAEVKLRDLDRDKAKVVAGLEDDELESLEMIQEALGDFASSPLGEAAIKQAEARR